MTALHFSGYGNICQGKKGKKNHLFALLWFPKAHPELGPHWLHAVKMSMQTKFLP